MFHTYTENVRLGGSAMSVDKELAFHLATFPHLLGLISGSLAGGAAWDFFLSFLESFTSRSSYNTPKLIFMNQMKYFHTVRSDQISEYEDRVILTNLYKLVNS